MAQGNWNPEVIKAKPRCRLCKRVVRSVDFVRLDGVNPAHRVCALARGRAYTEGKEIQPKTADYTQNMKTPADIAMDELRYALIDGLSDKADGYTLIRIEQILNGAPAGVAYNLADATMYVLVDDSDQSHAGLDELERLDLAWGLTEFFRTFVVPAQSTHGLPYWGGREKGPFVVYKFALLDRPLQLTY